MKNVMKIVFVVLATLIGAGFASGKEIFSFFFVYKAIGIIGIFISCSIMGLIIYRVLKVCNENRIDTYLEFCEFIGQCNIGNKVNKKSIINPNKVYKIEHRSTIFTQILNNIVNICLIITFYVMMAGFSSFLNQEFNVSRFLGGIIITILCYFAFKNDIKGLIKISDCLVPILIVFIVCISIKNINFNKIYNSILGTDISANDKITGIIKGVLYACYNCIILIPVLIPLRKQVKNNKEIRLVSIISCILLQVLSMAIYNLLLHGNTEIFSSEMPIIGIVKKYGSLYKNIYILIIGISIFTSAVSTGCGFLHNCSKNEKAYKRNLMLMCISAIFLSLVSFSTMVNVLYPVLGILGLIEVVLILCTAGDAS